MSNTRKFSPEVRERAVRLVHEHRGEYESQWAAVVSIAGKIGCTAQTLLNWIHQHERDNGQREGTTTDEARRIKDLGARGPRTAPRQRDSEAGERVFRPGGALNRQLK